MKDLGQGPYQEIPDRCYSQRKELAYTQPSAQGMMYINQLFHLEDGIKAKYISFDTIKKARFEKAKRICMKRKIKDFYTRFPVNSKRKR